jgi:putative transposase
MNKQLSRAKEIYNHLLEKANEKYKSERKMLTKFDMNKYITEFKKLHPEYQEIHSQVLQNISDRLSKAFSNFFKRVRRKKAGEKIRAGFPRFKKCVKSMTYPQSGFRLLEERKLHLSKIGNIPIILHRHLTGNVKTLTINRTQSGKWFVFFSCELSEEIHSNALPNSGKRIGIDVGIEKFATLSNGKSIQNPKFLMESEHKLKKIQRKVSRKKRGSNNRKKAVFKLAKLHERIADQRNDFLHKLSKKLTEEYNFIAVENLQISGMLRNSYPSLSKHISDASWNSFIQMLSYKAASAGGKVVCVNPKGTSQECSSCGQIVEKTLAVRKHSCPHCGLNINRDHNAAINILKRAENTARLAGIHACGDQANTLSPVDRASRVEESGTICDIQLDS